MARWHYERLNRPALNRIMMEDGRSRRRLMEQIGISKRSGVNLFCNTSTQERVRSSTIDALAAALGVDREELILREPQGGIA